jgi:hypothetical protein
LYVESGSLATSLDGNIDGPHRTFLALHAGITEWDEDRQVLTVAGTEMALDEPVMIGGSGGDLSGIEWHVPPAPECDAATGWIAGDASDPVLQAGWLVRDYGYRESESVELHLALIEAGPIVGELQVLLADRLGGTWPVYSPEPKVVVWLTGDEPPSAESEALASRSPVPVEFRTSARHSLAELRTALGAIRSDLNANGWFEGAQISAPENGVTVYARSDALSQPFEAVQSALTIQYGVPVLLHVEGGPVQPVLTAEEALRRDAETYAEEFGISLEEAMRRLELQSGAGDFGNQLELAAGERYAGHWIEHEPDYRLILALSGDEAAPADLLALAASGPISVTVTVGSHSFASLRAAQDALSPVPPAVAGTYVDVRRNAVVVMWAAQLSQAEIAAVEADWFARHRVPVLIELVQKPGVDGGED